MYCWILLQIYLCYLFCAPGSHISIICHYCWENRQTCWNCPVHFWLYRTGLVKSLWDILEWFLKDHVTLKTGVWCWNSALQHRNKLNLKIYANRIFVKIFHNITVFTVFLIKQMQLWWVYETSETLKTDPKLLNASECTVK